MKIYSVSRNRYYERTEPEKRFWNKVKKTENCWIWTASKTTTGYGKFNPDHTRMWESASRFSWKLQCGDIPKGQFVCHKCNFKLCVRPDHLYLATSRKNTMDAVKDGLNPVGEKHGMAKITEIEVKEIRMLYEPRKMSLRILGKRYNLTSTQVRRIVRRETWRHI